jgi:hypothetical protein
MNKQFEYTYPGPVCTRIQAEDGYEKYVKEY